MHKTLIVCLVLAGLSGALDAQDCQDCRDCTGGCEINDRASDAPAGSVQLSDAIAKLEKNGETKTLAKLQKACGVKSVAELKEQVAAYEKYAPMGCDVSQKRLVSLAGLMTPNKPQIQIVPLSVRVTKLSDGSLKALHGIAKTDSRDALVKHIQSLEAKPGCESCVTKLATLAAKLPKAKAPVKLSMRVSKMLLAEKAGCGKASAALKPLYAAAGTGCCKALISHIETLETKAAKGCSACTAQLAKLATMIPAAPPTPVKATDSTDSTGATGVTDSTGVTETTKAVKKDCAGGADCSDCGGCPGGSCPGR